MSRRAQRFRISAQKGKHAGNRRHTSSRAWKSRLGDPQIRSSSSSGMNIRRAAPPHTCCGKGHRAAQHSRPSSYHDASFIFPHLMVFGGCEEVSKVFKSFGNTHTHTHTQFSGFRKEKSDAIHEGRRRVTNKHTNKRCLIHEGRRRVNTLVEKSDAIHEGWCRVNTLVEKSDAIHEGWCRVECLS